MTIRCRSTTIRFRSTAVVAAVLGLALAACGGSTASTSEAVAPTEQVSASQDLLEAERTVETQITLCMRNLGFEYQLDVGAVARRAASAPDSDLDPYEYAAVYGFGITTSQGEQATETGTDSDPGSAAEASANASADPNADYLGTLGDEGQAAWNAALWGEAESDISTEQGCYGQAVEAVYSSLSAPATADVDYSDAVKRAESDPDMIALRKQWGKCMTDQGFAYAQPLDIFEDLQAQLGSALEPSALSELQDYERELAIASLDCNLSQDQEYQSIVARYTSN